MKALLWKDFSMSLPVMIAGGCAFFIPFLVVVLVMVSTDINAGERPLQVLVAGLGASAIVGLMFSQVLIAAFAANAIAGERSDRSAEFLFTLPAHRWQILASKFLIAFAGSLALWVIHLVIADLICDRLTGGAAQLADSLPPRWPIATLGIFGFGASWLASAFLGSPAKAFGAGAGMVIAVNYAFFVLHVNLGWMREHPGEFYGQWCAAANLLLGIATLAIGAWYFLRRVEP
jgi:ABC-type transport system involved in multi-copper enzyme maturation permease subunit